ncbi:hypothetical protein BDR26DRAFT_864847 [Obelidium mucronatum]|nr:hypothetical protein BDR26DRAFT_864847 [Obelidium mucronatum]
MESHFRCTRCRDTYLVLETPTPLITSIWQDKYLSFAVTLLLGSTSFVLFALLYCLYQEQWVVGQKLRLAVPLPWGVFGGQFLLDVTLFAGSMLAICYFMCWCMWCLLKDFFRGEVTRHVKEVEILAEEK